MKEYLLILYIKRGYDTFPIHWYNGQECVLVDHRYIPMKEFSDSPPWRYACEICFQNPEGKYEPPMAGGILSDKSVNKLDWYQMDNNTEYIKGTQVITIIDWPSYDYLFN